MYDFSGDQILGNSYTVNFFNNTANGLGQDIYSYNSNITVDNNAKVLFDGNALKDLWHSPRAVYIHYSIFTFKGDSMVTFSNNVTAFGRLGNGGYLYIVSSTTIFEGNSKVIFNGNKTSNQFYNGGCIYTNYSSNITFEGNSTVAFLDNYANSGAALYIRYSNITFKGNSKVTFHKNKVNSMGGAVYLVGSRTVFKENSILTFSECWSEYGGAMYIGSFSNIIFEGSSTVEFYNNEARYSGGAVYIHYGFLSKITCKEDSVVTFNDNKAKINDGGAVYSEQHSTITFEGNCRATSIIIVLLLVMVGRCILIFTVVSHLKGTL